ncbi:hypothetical protein BD414DRAFT_493693 [Trametes punicea]|nr:hypothetical protein BD414DRAFT_493693 [Trametes punicea]
MYVPALRACVRSRPVAGPGTAAADNSCAHLRAWTPHLAVYRPLTTATGHFAIGSPRTPSVVRARFTSGIPHEPLDLPHLPPAPRYPCPFLTDEEIQTHLVPLYERAWTIQPSSSNSTPAPELVKRCEFTSEAALGLFLDDLKEITASENHHAVQETTSSPPSVTIRVHTHSGLRPATHPDEPRRTRVQPGITLRDVRFACLAEERFAKYVTSGRGIERSSMVSTVQEEEQPRSAEALEARRWASGRSSHVVQ